MYCFMLVYIFCFSSRRRHTRCALVTGVRRVLFRSVPLPLAQRLARQIEAGGPISVAHYMAEANAHYYNSRDPLGAAGDFTTAPEISQMFGELVGLWLADIWIRSGRKDHPLYVELGPGRGTLAADALRAMQMAALTPKGKGRKSTRLNSR